MGFLDAFRKPRTPMVSSILPDIAKQEILNGRLPILRTDKVFLKSNETCRYIDKAIYEKRVNRKRYVRRNTGYSVPGLFKGDRINFGGGHTDVTDNVQYETYRGIIYLTDLRIIFVGDQTGFEKNLNDLVATTPYLNCLELQFSKESYRLFVPDGNVLNRTLHLIKQ